jgi:hypothetical protein
MKVLNLIIITLVATFSIYSQANVSSCGGKSSVDKDAAIYTEKAAKLAGNNSTPKSSSKSKKVVKSQKRTG